MTILDRILACRRERLEAEKRTVPLADVQAALTDLHDLPRDFARMLTGPCVKVIAEIKRRSPSQGQLAELVDPRFLAQDYASGGATAISVLTEQDFFDGDPSDLKRARGWVPLPILRKDFLIDEYQIYQSRLLYADAVLLIARALSENQLREFLAITRSLSMEALVEVHDEHELAVALACGAAVIGINNRDLDTLEIDLATTERLAPAAPPSVVLVSESGIHSVADVERVAAAGADAILVGTHLMRHCEPYLALRPLAHVPAQPQVRKCTGGIIT